jgi:hypothetical protein
MAAVSNGRAFGPQTRVTHGDLALQARLGKRLGRCPGVCGLRARMATRRGTAGDWAVRFGGVCTAVGFWRCLHTSIVSSRYNPRSGLVRWTAERRDNIGCLRGGPDRRRRYR